MKTLILKSVKRPKFYKDVAKEVKANPSNCSEALNEMAILGLVERSGERGFYRQTPVVRKMDVDVKLNKGRIKRAPSPNEDSSIRIVKQFDVEHSLDILDVDAEIIRDCFPLRKPFRTHAGEAYLTLENVMKRELNLPDTVYGANVVPAARQRGVFNRSVPSETDALVQLYNSAFLWYRNILHHRKDELSKEEALKVILHADYLIKLFRKQMQLNSIPLQWS